MRKAQTITVGMSGGVDSSVAAFLLKSQGARVRGLFMKNWEEDDTQSYCAARIDLVDVEAVCRALDLPFDTVNFATEYWNDVFKRFLAEYRAGRTPNPDIWCNQAIKFDAFLEHALARGAESIATGHYARIAHSNGDDGLMLKKGRDPLKDQSYFLYTLGQKQLSHVQFPLGTLDKSTVRDLARQANLSVHAKKDSVGICFIGERPFREFLSRYITAEPGEMRCTDGQLIGEHQGLMFYTLGQRQGLGIGGLANRTQAPWYVVDKDTTNNTLIVAQGQNHPLMYSNALIAGELTWVSGEAPTLPLACAAKNRYRQPDQACRLEPSEGNGIIVRFAAPQRAVTPGQSVVFYAEDTCLGGGIIEQRLNL